MPKVSVIIPCYNYGRFLEAAVDSVLAQTFQDFEVIIVNDGSTDEFTNNLLASYNKPKTRVLTQANQGLGGARNSGIRVSSGEYIVCLDADDKLHPEFLSKTIPILDADEEQQYGFVMTWVQLFGDLNYVWETADYDPYLVCMRNGMHPAAPFRKVCWDAAGGYNEHMTTCGYEDWDFWIAIAALGYKWITLKEPLIYYRKRAGSMLEKATEKRLVLFREMIRNHHYYYRANYEEIMVRGLEYFDAALAKCNEDLAARLRIIHAQERHQKELETKCQKLHMQVDNLTNRVDTLTSSLNRCESDRMEKIEMINVYDNRQCELQNMCDNLHIQVDNLTIELETFKSSLSWKMTAPFRAMLDLLRRGKR